MIIKMSDPMGFCFGVSRAINMAEDLSENGQIYSLGPLIHNVDEIKRLETKGVVTVDGLEENMDLPVLIRSHGASKEVYEFLNENGIAYYDATCPFVKRIHELVKKYLSLGKDIAILGDGNHPEVQGIISWGERISVLKDMEAVEAFNPGEELVLLAQTTLNKEFYDKALENLSKRTRLNAINTICSATKLRQEAAKELAGQVDMMIVVGGKASSNTKKLYEICKSVNKNTIHVENIREIIMHDFQKYAIIGISAGASTPDWIVNEIVEYLQNETVRSNLYMENLSMKEMMEQSSFSAPKRNEVVTGKVVMVKDDGVVVNIGYKADGIIPLDEISNPENLPLEELFAVDEELEVLVVKRDNGEGDVLLSSKRLKSRKDWELLEEKFNNKETVTVKITEVVKGGLSAHFNDIRAFIPASHVDVNFVRDLNQFIGEECQVEFLDFDRRRNQVVFSRKAVIEKERKDEMDNFWEGLEAGQVREGVVRRFTNYGAFIDLGATDGLIHVSEIQWGKVNKPSDVLKANETLDFMVLDFDRESNKISLSRKALSPDPWEIIDDNYVAGENYDGKIVSLTDFGAFVELEPGLEGLIHVSQISEDRIDQPKDVLSMGEEVVVRILEIDKDQKRIKLSMKQ
ncbi:MAG: bifunctional 4-hydroxy-3-methylbut-2-enyl diphosphate reductase/30S ribosomal protein S1, partial [Tissierellia bacterium]|nr:bifunctional 4-hydroxy-3-methylbut-2-enyl diphosphate reductase/30S ribosomal protein S1 [Tissierellia bacterium]